MRLILLALFLAVTPAQAGIVALDGDTIIVGQEHIRIVGLDTPEIRGRCLEDAEKAVEAKAALTRLLTAGSVQIERSAFPDRYGRTLAVVKVDGIDVAETMISGGYARPLKAHERRWPWCR